jgi:hypothetical protein
MIRRPTPDARLAGAFLLVALGCAGAQPLPAQEAPTATIREILLLQAGGTGSMVPGPTDRVLRQSAAGPWERVAPREVLILQDRLLVEPRTVVRLDLRNRAGEGRAHLTADPESGLGSVPLDSIGGAGRGLYEIGESPEEPGRMEVRVVQGSVVLHWVRGRLDLWAADWRATITGTRVLLTVSEDGERAALHLVEGSVMFPGAEDFLLRPGETALIRAGVPPILYPGPEPVAVRMAEAADWSSRGAWPGGASPWMVAGVAAGGAAAGLLIRSLIRGGGSSPGRSGSVIVRLPF